MDQSFLIFSYASRRIKIKITENFVKRISLCIVRSIELYFYNFLIKSKRMKIFFSRLLKIFVRWNYCHEITFVIDGYFSSFCSNWTETTIPLSSHPTFVAVDFLIENSISSTSPQKNFHFFQNFFPHWLQTNKFTSNLNFHHRNNHRTNSLLFDAQSVPLQFSILHVSTNI